MLIIISDLHLMDGTAGRHQLEADTFREIFMEIAQQANQAFTGLENDEKEVKIILLGDIFDLIRTESWFKWKSKDTGTEVTIDLKDRPWGEPNSATEMIANHILSDIVQENEEILSILSGREWKNLGFQVKPEIIYVPGNHDRLCNVYESLRQRVINILNLKGISPNNYFPAFFKSWDYGVFARHGHEWDPFNFEGDFRNEQSYFNTPIGDVIASEIASKLPIQVELNLKSLNLKDEDIKRISDHFRNLFDVRPISSIVAWLSSQVDLCSHYGSDVQNAINLAVRQIGIDFMNIPFVKKWIKEHNTRWNPFDNGDKIYLLGTILKKFDLHNFAWKLKVIEIWEQIKAIWTNDEHINGAEKEFKGLSPRFQYVLYGHTHEPLFRVIDIKKEGSDQEEELVYLNTGTWRPRYHQSLTGKGFSALNNLTYTVFYKKNERYEHVPFEFWTGTTKNRDKIKT